MTRRWFVSVVLVLLAAGAIHDLYKLRNDPPWQNMVDLSVFYCAGTVAGQRTDAYDTGAERACQHGVNSGGVWNDPQYGMLVPQPPYDIAAFEPLARLSFSAAKVAAALAIVAAVIVAALALADIGIPFWAALAALALSDGFVSLSLGQIYPLVIALVALACAALRRGQSSAAGSLAALTLIEPQLGVPVAIAAFVWIPRSRIALSVTVALMLAAGAIAMGPHAYVEWVTQVLPAEARGEAGFWAQYSLTSLLVLARIPLGVALAAGTLSYLALLGLALWLGPRLAKRWNRHELVLLVPAAFATIGGSFVHLAAVAAALPLVLVLALPDLRRSAAPLCAAILLAIPWLLAQALKPLFFSALLAAFVILVALRANVRATIAIALGTAVVLYLLAVHTPPPISPTTVFDASRELAKLPTWLGLLTTIGVAL